MHAVVSVLSMGLSLPSDDWVHLMEPRSLHHSPSPRRRFALGARVALSFISFEPRCDHTGTLVGTQGFLISIALLGLQHRFGDKVLQI